MKWYPYVFVAVFALSMLLTFGTSHDLREGIYSRDEKYMFYDKDNARNDFYTGSDTIKIYHDQNNKLILEFQRVMGNFHTCYIGPAELVKIKDNVYESRLVDEYFLKEAQEEFDLHEYGYNDKDESFINQGLPEEERAKIKIDAPEGASMNIPKTPRPNESMFTCYLMVESMADDLKVYTDDERSNYRACQNLCGARAYPPSQDKPILLKFDPTLSIDLEIIPK